MKSHSDQLERKVIRSTTAMAIAVIILCACSPSVLAQWTTPDTNQNINSTNTGNVGIGTTSPGTSLDVSGNIINVGSELGTKNRANNTIKVSRIAMPPYTTSNMRFALLGGATLSNANIVALGGEVGGMAAATQIDFFTAPTTNVDTGTLRMIINSAGNVGIGTSSPASLLNLVGANAALTFGTAGAADSSTFTIDVAASGSLTNGQNGRNLVIKAGNSENAAGRVGGDLFLNPGVPIAPATTYGRVLLATGGGNVGIGTTSPLQRLQIGTNTVISTATPDSVSLGATYSSVAGANPKLRLFDNNAGSVYGLGVSNGQFDFMIPATARFVWSVNGVEKMRLDESGSITISGNINAKYQDVAEWVESSQSLTPGTVVVLDSTKSNQVIAATRSYDSHVAGVISLQPGIALGEQGEGRVLVATTGRVKIKVDATNGPIQIGDLLVTSDREGFAMKSVPVEIGGVRIHRPGTLIGKALEPLAQGTGEILVLLSLQ